MFRCTLFHEQIVAQILFLRKDEKEWFPLSGPNVIIICLASPSGCVPFVANLENRSQQYQSSEMYHINTYYAIGFAFRIS
ncbi:hypothetical protein CEXT_630841 [Caerostris extrusa]|uniref:Uncharacterized protein n=1 Tax=Caerostris extrusa TaxID=172846 RepID=A0AAV4Q827_CAEEX|nr:hypothetical protein CEXT_630841 [Caerostris extrusa]